MYYTITFNVFKRRSLLDPLCFLFFELYRKERNHSIVVEFYSERGDFVIFHNRSLGRYCQISQVPNEIVFNGNEMFVIFSTDSSGNDIGFSAEFLTQPRRTTSSLPSSEFCSFLLKYISQGLILSTTKCNCRSSSSRATIWCLPGNNGVDQCNRNHNKSGVQRCRRVQT